MKRHGNICALLVASIGSGVMASWVLGFEFGTKIVDGEASMKFNTALCFLLCGLTWFFFSMRWRNNVTDALGAMFAFGQMGIMLTLITSQLSGGVSPLASFAGENGNIEIAVSAMPSLCTLSSFLFVTLASICWVTNVNKLVVTFGALTMACGLIGIVGYGLNWLMFMFGINADASALYCYLSNDASSAMAIHTAFSFVLIGVSIMWTAKSSKAIE